MSTSDCQSVFPSLCLCLYLFARFLYLAAIKKYSNSLPGRGSVTKVVAHQSPLSPTKVCNDFCHQPSGVSTQDSYGIGACDFLRLDCAVVPNKLESATLDRWKVCLEYDPDTCTNAPMGFISFQMQLRLHAVYPMLAKHLCTRKELCNNAEI